MQQRQTGSGLGRHSNQDGFAHPDVVVVMLDPRAGRCAQLRALRQQQPPISSEQVGAQDDAGDQITYAQRLLHIAAGGYS